MNFYQLLSKDGKVEQLSYSSPVCPPKSTRPIREEMSIPKIHHDGGVDDDNKAKPMNQNPGVGGLVDKDETCSIETESCSSTSSPSGDLQSRDVTGHETESKLQSPPGRFPDVGESAAVLTNLSEHDSDDDSSTTSSRNDDDNNNEIGKIESVERTLRPRSSLLSSRSLLSTGAQERRKVKYNKYRDMLRRRTPEEKLRFRPDRRDDDNTSEELIHNNTDDEFQFSRELNGGLIEW